MISSLIGTSEFIFKIHIFSVVVIICCPVLFYRCLEEGAEEFLLKPVRLSDLEKLQPHLLKSLNRSCGNNEDSDNDNKNEISNCKSTNNGAFSKRKALSAEAPERRPKMKEVAVV